MAAKKNPTLLQRLTNAYNILRGVEVPDITNPAKATIPPGQVSQPDFPNEGLLAFVKGETRLIQPSFVYEVIPYLRKLALVNPDVGQALNNYVTLANTGHKIKFDPNVPPEIADKMRVHLQNKGRYWGDQRGGMHGIVNRMFGQIALAGALSVEWVPNILLNGIDRQVFINPETIFFSRDENTGKFIPWQKTKHNFTFKYPDNLIPLNPITYKYYPLNGDEDVPYGFPPYMASLNNLKIQSNMTKNIDYIVDQVGLLGFLQVLLDKPDQIAGENENAYKARLESLLKEASSRVKGGLRDGISVAYKDDVEYDFNATTKNTTGVKDLFQENELQVMSGLKTDGSLMGRGYSTSETQITVIFTKLLSELKNSQSLVKETLEFGYTMELKLAGFKFDYLSVVFNPSTLQDELKYQQALEIKVRNAQSKYNMGIISQDQVAEELGYEVPDQAKPRVEVDLAGKAIDKKAREDQKNKSDKKVRSKNKPGSA